MADQEDRIFTGTLFLDEQDISVLGHVGERKITDFTSVRSVSALPSGWATPSTPTSLAAVAAAGVRAVRRGRRA